VPTSRNHDQVLLRFSPALRFRVTGSTLFSVGSRQRSPLPRGTYTHTGFPNRSQDSFALFARSWNRLIIETQYRALSIMAATPSDVINWQEAMQQVGDDEEFLKELLGDLRTELQTQLTTILGIIQVGFTATTSSGIVAGVGCW